VVYMICLLSKLCRLSCPQILQVALDARPAIHRLMK
jgi:hypothetical protein